MASLNKQWFCCAHQPQQGLAQNSWLDIYSSSVTACSYCIWLWQQLDLLQEFSCSKLDSKSRFQSWKFQEFLRWSVRLWRNLVVGLGNGAWNFSHSVMVQSCTEVPRAKVSVLNSLVTLRFSKRYVFPSVNSWIRCSHAVSLIEPGGSSR